LVTEAICHGLEHEYGLFGDFGADTVAGENSDV
jgi:hypothetical protein